MDNGPEIILECLTHGPTALQSKNPGPYCQGHGTAHNPQQDFDFEQFGTP